MKILPYLPGFVAGVFLSRVAGEWFGLPNVWAAAGLALALGGLGAWLIARRPFSKTWPALFLLAYILSPEPRLGSAALVAAAAVVALLLTWRRSVAPEEPPATARECLRSSWPWALAVGGFFFLLYLYTLAPDVLAADSGELQVVAAQLGVAHPPGFPLYTLAAHLLVRALPFVSPAYAVNLFSAITSAAAVAVVFLAAVLITRNRFAALIAAVALGTATTYWSQATTANVRSLTGLLAALILFALFAFRYDSSPAGRGRPDRWLTLAAFFMGLGLAHHISLVFLIGVGLVFILITEPTFIRMPSRWVRPVLAGMIGLLPWLYLPLRATADARGASPGLATWSGFLEHALATGFRGDLFYYIAPADFFQRLRIMGNVMSFQFEAIVLVGIVLGGVLTLWRDRALAWLLGGTLAVFILVAATYRAPQTVEYMLPGYIAAALLLAYGVDWLPQAAARWGAGGVMGVTAFTALVAVSCGYQFFANQTAAGRFHEGWDARDYAQTVLESAPPGSSVLAHWHWATPMWYLQEVEGFRPDIDVQYVYPEGASYDDAWRRRVTEAYSAGHAVLTTWFPAAPLDSLPVPEPVGEAQLYPIEARQALPEGFTETELTLANVVTVLGYHVEQTDHLSAGQEGVITVAWRPLAELSPGTNLFIHLAGPDGALYAQDDRPAIPAEEITLTQFRYTPRPGTPLGTLQALIGVSGAADAREPLVAIPVGPSPRAPYTANVTERRLVVDETTALAGYDWDHTLAGRPRLYLHWRTSDGYHTEVIDDASSASAPLSPYRGAWGVPVNRWRFPRGIERGHYVPFGQGIVWTGESQDELALGAGESAVLEQTFHSAGPINRDYVVSVRLIGLEPDGIHWAWWDLQDAIPAMGAIPTLKWVSDSSVRSPHRVTAADSAVPGQSLAGALALYDSFTNRPLPILDERITAQNPWVPVAQGIIETRR